jgi:hypothetical protein
MKNHAAGRYRVFWKARYTGLAFCDCQSRKKHSPDRSCSRYLVHSFGSIAVDEILTEFIIIEA